MTTKAIAQPFGEETVYLELTPPEEAAEIARANKHTADQAAEYKKSGYLRARIAKLPPDHEMIPILIEAIKTVRDSGITMPAEVNALIAKLDTAKTDIPKPL